ncbi:MAG TPA: iron-sulfur cluster repair di-iron protein [Thermoanaerobaculia bacterium]|nr:iron-sulfur cluster repair di-iron protein [Thermoanaerobaculia bacterium]
MKTIGQLAIEEPKAIAVLEKLSIDYCCHGNRGIDEACKDAGITVTELLTAIGATPADASGRDWKSASLKEVQQYIIQTHHVFTRDMLQTVNQLAAKVADRHGAHHPEVAHVYRLVQQLVADLMPHMMKEEQILFPYVEQLEEGDAPPPFFGTVQNPIRMMMMEHDAVADVLVELRSITNNYALPGDACISFRALYERLQDLEQDLHRHIHLENNVLFPRAVELESGSCVTTAV